MLTTTRSSVPQQRTPIDGILDVAGADGARLAAQARAAQSLAKCRYDDPHAWRLALEHLIADTSRVVAVRSRELYPRVGDGDPDDAAVLAQVLTARAEVESAMLALLRRLHGDAHERRPVGRLQATALAALARYLDREAEWLVTIDDTLRRVPEVASRMRTLYRHAPTRPHPHAPHQGAAGRIAFRVNSWLDHVRDTLDSRPVSVARAPASAL